MHNKNNGAEVTKLIYLSTYTYLVLPRYRKKPVAKKIIMEWFFAVIFVILLVGKF